MTWTANEVSFVSQWFEQRESPLNAAIIRRIYGLDDLELRRLPDDGWVTINLAQLAHGQLNSSDVDIVFGDVPGIDRAENTIGRKAVSSFAHVFDDMYDADSPDRTNVLEMMQAMDSAELRDRFVQYVLCLRPIELAAAMIIESASPPQ
jgi:hypothetical protein